MKEYPILFSSLMVRAILEGRKTQTRQVVKGTALDWLQPGMFIPQYVANPGNYLSPYGFAGDRLWVRETFAEYPNGYVYKANYANDGFGSQIANLETGDLFPLVWKPSIHMPRKASRIILDVVNVRIEQLHDISEEDARAEGVVWQKDFGNGIETREARAVFVDLWNTINEKRGYGWDVNPWVWVVEFQRQGITQRALDSAPPYTAEELDIITDPRRNGALRNPPSQ